MLHRAINKVASRGANWSTVLIEITVSSVKVTDCVVRVHTVSFKRKSNRDLMAMKQQNSCESVYLLTTD